VAVWVPCAAGWWRPRPGWDVRRGQGPSGRSSARGGHVAGPLSKSNSHAHASTHGLSPRPATAPATRPRARGPIAAAASQGRLPRAQLATASPAWQPARGDGGQGLCDAGPPKWLRRCRMRPTARAGLGPAPVAECPSRAGLGQQDRLRRVPAAHRDGGVPCRRRPCRRRRVTVHRPWPSARSGRTQRVRRLLSSSPAASRSTSQRWPARWVDAPWGARFAFPAVQSCDLGQLGWKRSLLGPATLRHAPNPTRSPADNQLPRT
jgi:hypothetical protein